MTTKIAGSPGLEIDLVNGYPRIRGDFTNNSFINRLAFQTTTVNGGTVINVLPHGSGNVGAFNAFGSSDPTNASRMIAMVVGGERVTFESGITGAGIYLPMTFHTGGSERMRLTTGGSLLIGAASNYAGRVEITFAKDAQHGIVLKQTVDTGGGGTAIQFINAAGAGIGMVSASATAVSYNTSSDYRLKDNIVDLSDSGEFIDALLPRAWTWKADGSSGTGFIAHELQAVSPSSVTGEKDAVDEEGNPQYQAVEYGSAEVIAHLVKEIQSLRQRVAALEAV